jgi:hypothetical protein
MWLLSGCTFSRYARKSFEKASVEKPFDVVIVPGVPYQGDSTTIVMKMRLHWAKFLYDSGFTKHIIFSGSAVYTPYIEGIVMKIMADSLGLPREKTFSETKAEHSTENVYYSWLMAKEMGFKKVGLATDQFQAGLLRRFMRRYCPGVKAIPIIQGTLNINQRVLPKIDPSSARVENFISITQRESFFKRFRYTLGKRVKDAHRQARRDARKKKKASG